MKLVLLAAAAAIVLSFPAQAQLFGTNTPTFAYWLPSYGMDQLPMNLGAYGQGYADVTPGTVQGTQVPKLVGNVGFWTFAQNYQSGPGYKIEFDAPNPGAVNATVGGMFNGLTNVQRSGSHYSATFTINHDGGNVLAGGGEVDLAGASAANPVTNFRVTRPGGTVGSFTPTFQSYLNNYQAIRWMGDSNVNNNNNPLTAADVLPSGQNISTFGNSPDDIIRQANAQPNLKKVWINIPANADDSYIKAVAAKFATGLNPDKQVVVEYSNENWNFAFTHPGLTVYAKAQADPRVTAGDTYTAVAQESGLQSARVMQLFKSTFTANGKDPNRAQGFLGSQGANQWFVDQGKLTIDRVFGPGTVDKLFDYQGISFYPADNLAGASSVDQLVSALYTDLNRQKQYLQNDKLSAGRDGLHEAVYEWGMNGYLTQGGVPQAVWQAFRDDPRSKQWVIDEYNTMKGVLDAGDLAMEFTVLGDGWGPQVNPLAPPEFEQQGIVVLSAQNTQAVTPEPAALSLFILAGAGLLARRRAA